MAPLAGLISFRFAPATVTFEPTAFRMLIDFNSFCSFQLLIARSPPSSKLIARNTQHPSRKELWEKHHLLKVVIRIRYRREGAACFTRKITTESVDLRFREHVKFFCVFLLKARAEAVQSIIHHCCFEKCSSNLTIFWYFYLLNWIELFLRIVAWIFETLDVAFLSTHLTATLYAFHIQPCSMFPSTSCKSVDKMCY